MYYFIVGEKYTPKLCDLVHMWCMSSGGVQVPRVWRQCVPGRSHGHIPVHCLPSDAGHRLDTLKTCIQGTQRKHQHAAHILDSLYFARYFEMGGAS